ncbi:NAD(P)-dependent alcohol dehydrogenase [Dinoroseobacter sp. PD6]|uniref:NAD(P)-dependent alcohol dehydrogenase n=1 Tax=Dinoroseobacter sp. PD6 TaxID=3028384 RepID=UPI00237B0FDA|nr:NAD(P)-dependent alcohol dehydrogenase [Dinoroseobacter sp. PD6]MDD9718649.1 NAD(P)-dependent alcohol dehydrogenase [Dinoroseobacter sp. PD6]
MPVQSQFQSRPATMTVATARRYGGPEVLALETMPVPSPAPGEVLVRIHASTVTTGDWRLRGAAYPKGLRLVGRLVSGLFRPRHVVPGVTFSGTVVATGEGAARFAVGEPVFGGANSGGHAEYIVVPETGAIAAKPMSLTHAQAAALPFGAATADHFLRHLGQVRGGERVLITGASGAVGHAGIQIAKALGAHVTALTSPGNIDFVGGLGAEEVIDYTRQDVAEAGARFDVVFDTIGHLDFGRARGLLRRGGRYLTTEGGWREGRQMLVPWRRHGHVLRFGISEPDATQLLRLAEMAEAGKLAPAIERSFPLAEIARAHEAVETRRRRGVIALDMRPSSGDQPNLAAA